MGRRGHDSLIAKHSYYVAMIPVGLDTIGSVVYEDKRKQVTPESPVPV